MQSCKSCNLHLRAHQSDSSVGSCSGQPVNQAKQTHQQSLNARVHRWYRLRSGGRRSSCGGRRHRWRLGSRQRGRSALCFLFACRSAPPRQHRRRHAEQRRTRRRRARHQIVEATRMRTRWDHQRAHSADALWHAAFAFEELLRLLRDLAERDRELRLTRQPLGHNRAKQIESETRIFRNTVIPASRARGIAHRFSQ